MQVPYVEVLEIIRSNELIYPGSLKCVGYRMNLRLEDTYTRKGLLSAYVIAPPDLRRFMRFQKKLLWDLGTVIVRTIHCSEPRSYIIVLESVIRNRDIRDIISTQKIKTTKGHTTYPKMNNKRKGTDAKILNKIKTMLGPPTMNMTWKSINNVPEFINQLDSRLWEYR
jgi:hypothetical protein